MFAYRVYLCEWNEISRRVAVLKVSLLEKDDLALVHNDQHAYKSFILFDQLDWEGLTILKRKKALDFEKLIEERVTSHLGGFFQSFGQKQRHVFDDIHDGCFGSPLACDTFEIIVKRIESKLDWILNMKVDSWRLIRVTRFQYDFKLKFIQKGDRFQILEFVFVDLDDDGDLHSPCKGVSGLETHPLLGLPQILYFQVVACVHFITLLI